MADIFFEYDLKLTKGSILKPHSFSLQTEKSGKQKVRKPLKYYSDALVALGFYNLSKSLGHDHWNGDHNHLDIWRHLEPSFEMYGRSRKRILALHEQASSVDDQLLENFEKKMVSCLTDLCHGQKVNLKDFGLVNDLIDYLEDRLQKPLLFNFSLHFSPEFQQQLLYLYSFLWNIRSLVAYDHNSHIEDPCHEALKMDSITDYLPKAEYVVNDALMYHEFKKMFVPFTSGRSSDVKISKLLFEPMNKNFHQLSHDACQLIDQLPEKFIKALRPKELEEALYLVQMDWLLGSEAGLLFKIREEIFGLTEGYENIFWQDYDYKQQGSANLHIACELPWQGSQKSVA